MSMSSIQSEKPNEFETMIEIINGSCKPLDAAEAWRSISMPTKVGLSARDPFKTDKYLIFSVAQGGERIIVTLEFEESGKELSGNYMLTHIRVQGSRVTVLNSVDGVTPGNLDEGLYSLLQAR